MSYTKLFQATIVSLHYTFLEYSDGYRKKVWFYLTFLGSQHIILALIASFVHYILPSSFLLLFSYRLQAFSFSWLNKIKPLLDAYYAPYRAKTRYWPGFMLLVRGCLYTAFSVTISGANLVAISSVFTAVALMPSSLWKALQQHPRIILHPQHLLQKPLIRKLWPTRPLVWVSYASISTFVSKTPKSSCCWEVLLWRSLYHTLKRVRKNNHLSRRLQWLSWTYESHYSKASSSDSKCITILCELLLKNNTFLAKVWFTIKVINTLLSIFAI